MVGSTVLERYLQAWLFDAACSAIRETNDIVIRIYPQRLLLAPRQVLALVGRGYVGDMCPSFARSGWSRQPWERLKKDHI